MMAYVCWNTPFPKVYNKHFKQWIICLFKHHFLKYIINNLNNGGISLNSHITFSVKYIFMCNSLKDYAIFTFIIIVALIIPIEVLKKIKTYILTLKHFPSNVIIHHVNNFYTIWTCFLKYYTGFGTYNSYIHIIQQMYRFLFKHLIYKIMINNISLVKKNISQMIINIYNIRERPQPWI